LNVIIFAGVMHIPLIIRVGAYEARIRTRTQTPYTTLTRRHS